MSSSILSGRVARVLKGDVGDHVVPETLVVEHVGGQVLVRTSIRLTWRRAGSSSEVIFGSRSVLVTMTWADRQ